MPPRLRLPPSEAEMSSAPSSNPDHEVSWQSAFWGIAPLVLAVMTQPSGRICGFPERLRTYVRASPVICGLDIVYTICRLGVSLHRGATLQQAATGILPPRSHTAVVDNSHSHGLQSLEDNAVFRAIIFIFGTLPQAVKLFSLRGIPWTQACAAVYLASYANVELLLLARNFRKEQVGPGKPLAIELTISADLPTEVEILTCSIGFIGHGALVLYLYTMFWLQIISNPVSPDWRSILIWITFGISITAALLFVFLAIVHVFFSTRVSPQRQLLGKKIFIALYFLLLFFNVFAEPHHGYEIRWYTKLLMGYALLMGIGCLLVYLWEHSRPHPGLRRTLLFISEPPPAKDVEGLVSFLVLISLFLMMVITVLWYFFCFDSTGTYKPNWADVLG